MRTILFVCTGNTCRSPMAEAIAQHWVDHGLLGQGGGDDPRYLVASAGTMAGEGAGPSSEVVATLESLSIPFNGRSKPLTPDMIRNAEVVFAMTEMHAAAARMLVGEDSSVVHKILLLDPDGDVDDPIGQGQDTYDRLAHRLMDLIPKRLKEVFSHEDRAGIGPSRS